MLFSWVLEDALLDRRAGWAAPSCRMSCALMCYAGNLIILATSQGELTELLGGCAGALLCAGLSLKASDATAFCTHEEIPWTGAILQGGHATLPVSAPWNGPDDLALAIGADLSIAGARSKAEGLSYGIGWALPLACIAKDDAFFGARAYPAGELKRYSVTSLSSCLLLAGRRAAYKGGRSSSRDVGV